MTLEKECPCCGAIYSIDFVERLPSEEDIIDGDYADAHNLEPLFCPFCGANESDDPIDSEDE